MDTPDEISLVWTVYDVWSVCPGLTKDEAREVLRSTKRNHDGNMGVTWDRISELGVHKFGRRAGQLPPMTGELFEYLAGEETPGTLLEALNVLPGGDPLENELVDLRRKFGDDYPFNREADRHSDD